jgi:hypothetical protein
MWPRGVYLEMLRNLELKPIGFLKVAALIQRYL